MIKAIALAVVATCVATPANALPNLTGHSGITTIYDGMTETVIIDNGDGTGSYQTYDHGTGQSTTGAGFDGGYQTNWY